MAILHKNDVAHIRGLFGKLKNEVRIFLFTSAADCRYCGDAEELLKEVASLAGTIELRVLDLERDRALAEEMHVEHAPTTVICTANGALLQYVGIPNGYQLRCLVEDIVDASRGTTETPREAKAVIAKVQRPVVVNVFVLPGCAYSPIVVRAAHRLSMENPKVLARMVESVEFPSLAGKYDVVGVPTTIIDGLMRIEGAPAERELAERILEASQRQP